MCGVYPAKDAVDAGEEISSTYEGRHLTFLESELFHPYHEADGFVDKGDPVVAQTSTGYIVGVALKSAAAATDLIAIDTEGIWALKVYADSDEVWDKEASWAIVPGDQLFIDRVTTGAITAGVGACGISKRRDKATQVPFGFALGAVTNLGEGIIAVKVHNQGSFDLCRSMCNRNVQSGEMGWSFFGRIEDGHSEGIAGYVDATILGTPDGNNYGFGIWLALDDEATIGAAVVTPLDVGIYSGAAQAAATLFLSQFQAQLAGAPASLYLARVNHTQTLTALYYATGAGSLGYTAVVTESDAPIGYIPFATIPGVNGGKPVLIRVYADTD